MMMFETYCGSLPIHQLWYEFLSGTCPSVDLSLAPSCTEEHDTLGMIRVTRLAYIRMQCATMFWSSVILLQVSVL